MSASRLGVEKNRWPNLGIGLTPMLVIPVFTVLILGLSTALGPGSVPEFPCWMLPNGHVVESPANLACPLATNDLIQGVDTHRGWHPVSRAADLRAALLEAGDPARIEIRRAGETLWIDVPIRLPSFFVRVSRVATAAIATLFLLGIPLLLLWRSTWAASLPLAIFYASVSTVAATLLSARDSDPASRIAILSLLLIPAALAHLSFTFPREREIVRKAPQILALPYAAAALLLPVGWFALERTPLLWPPFMYLLVGMTTGMWIVLMLSCVYALREAPSAIEYARARLVLFGAFLTPLIPVAGYMLVASDIEGAALLYLWILPICLPIPIAVAIGRHDLFDLGNDLRFSVARMLYIALSALTLTFVLKAALMTTGAPIRFEDVSLIFPISVVSILILEPFRTRFSELIENAVAPRQRELGKLLENLTLEVSTIRDEDTSMRLIATTLEEGIRPGSGCLLIERGEMWCPAHLFGAHFPLRDGWVSEAQEALDGATWVHLAIIGNTRIQTPRLWGAGIEVIAVIDDGSRALGMLLIGSGDRRRPLLGIELEFLKGVCSQASIALQNVRLSEKLLAAQEQAATGRMALGIAHDIGKELTWMRKLARRLPDRTSDPARLSRDSGMLAELSKDIMATLKRFVDESTRSETTTMTRQPLDQLVQRAVQTIERHHGDKGISTVLDPESRKLSFHQNFGRALFNLLDNAAHASPRGQPIRLFATRENRGWLRVEIEDRGAGISKEERSRVFKPGYTTRANSGGSGIGLGVTQDILDSLGGEVTLHDAQPHGVRARLLIPLEATKRGDC